MNKKIKIMYVITQLQRGGAEFLLLNICSGLLKKDKNIEIKGVSLLNKLDLACEFEKHGIEVICLNVEHKRFPIKVYKLYKLIKKFKSDIVHSHLLNADRFAVIASLLAGVKHRTCTAHNIDLDVPRPEKLSRVICSILAEKIIAVSHSAKKFYIKNRIYPENKIEVIHNCPGFQIENIRPRYLSQRPYCIKLINIGSLRVQKGQIYLVQAMKILQKYPVKFQLEIYGRTIKDYDNVLKKEVSKLMLENVFFKGATDDVQRALKNSDILIASSLREAFHMVVLEAMSLGVPIVATKIPSHREILKNVDERMFVEPKDPEAIAKSVMILVENLDIYNKISQEVLKGAEKFSIEKAVDRYYNFYKNLMGI